MAGIPAEAAQAPGVLPGVQPQIESNIALPVEAAGGGQLRQQQAELGNEISQHMSGAIQLAEIKANQASTSERAAAANQQIQTVVDQYKNLHGSDAKDAYPDVVKKISQINDNIAATVPNAQVAQMYANAWNGLATDAHKAMQGHLQTEIQQYAKDSNANEIKGYQSQGVSAVGSPYEDELITSAQDKMEASIRKYGATLHGAAMDDNGNVLTTVGRDGTRQAVPAPATQMELDKQNVIFTQSVAQKLLDTSGGHAAVAYLKTQRAQDDLEAKAPKVYASLMDTANKRAIKDDAYNLFAPKVYAQFGPEGLAEAKAYTLDHIPEDAPYEKREESLAAVKQIYDAKTSVIMNEGWQYTLAHDGEMMPGIPPTFAARLEGQFKTYQTHVAVGKDDTDLKLSLTDMAYSQDPRERAQFSAANLNAPEYASRLTPSTLESLTRAQQAMRNPNKTAYTAAATAYTQQSQIANETMRHLGWDPEQPNNPQITQFRTDFEARVQQAQAGGARLDYNGMRDIAVKMGIDISMRNRPAPALVTSRTVTSDSISAPQRKVLAGVLKAHGVAVTDSALLKLQQAYETSAGASNAAP